MWSPTGAPLLFHVAVYRPLCVGWMHKFPAGCCTSLTQPLCYHQASTLWYVSVDCHFISITCHGLPTSGAPCWPPLAPTGSWSMVGSRKWPTHAHSITHSPTSTNVLIQIGVTSALLHHVQLSIEEGGNLLRLVQNVCHGGFYLVKPKILQQKYSTVPCWAQVCDLEGSTPPH